MLLEGSDDPGGRWWVLVVKDAGSLPRAESVQNLNTELAEYRISYTNLEV
jgi:hypothetical protein